MSLLEQRINELESDLLANPPRISAYHDLPFTILRYEPSEEFFARKQISLFATRLQNAGRRVHVISVARLLWAAIEDTEGIDAIAEEEQQFGFQRAQQTVSTLLSDESFSPLPEQIERRMTGLDPRVDVVILVRIASLGPAIYRSAKLLDEMHGRTMVPIVLFILAHSMERTAFVSWICQRAEGRFTMSQAVRIDDHLEPEAPEVETLQAEVERLQRELEEARRAPDRKRLAETRQSITHKFSICGHEGYIIAGLFEDGSPGEVFIKMAKQGSTISGLVDTIAILTSLALQYGVRPAIE